MRSAVQIDAKAGARNGASPFVVLAAVFALLIQAMLPSAVMAAQSAATDGLVICTAQGMETVRSDADGQPAKSVGGQPCPYCLAAATAAVVIGQNISVALVAYTARPSFHIAPAQDRPTLARPPPRPPSQAPPIA